MQGRNYARFCGELLGVVATHGALAFEGGTRKMTAAFPYLF